MIIIKRNYPNRFKKIYLTCHGRNISPEAFGTAIRRTATKIAGVASAIATELRIFYLEQP